MKTGMTGVAVCSHGSGALVHVSSELKGKDGHGKH